MNNTKSLLKSFTIILFSLIMALSGLLTFSTPNQAQAASKASLKVKVSNTEVPANAEQQAESQFSSYAQALSQIDKSGTNGEYKLGKPFKIYKFNGQENGNYYFPVLQGEHIKYVLTVTPKNENDVNADKNSANYSVRISKFIADSLNQYRQANTPITIFTNKDGYFAEHNHKIEMIKQTKLADDKTAPSTPAAPKMQMNKTVDASQPISQQRSVATKYVNTLPHFQIRETQGNNGWCAGFTMAALLNATKNTNQYRAQDIMRTIHPGLSGQRFQFTGLTPDEMIQYGRSQGKNPTYYNSMPSYDMVDQYTSDNKGIAILSERVESTNGLHGRHAMAVVGNAVLANNQKVIVFWNPWDSDVSLQPVDSNIIPVSDGSHFRWFASIPGY
ncbi:C47 family peptidase [Staphylococcus sp. HMSC065E08]|uniref:C47 family peptidase n=1 Tax=Staphylococcus sp. HMSC065E08 TaxID=1739510 RepID=UPI0008D5EACF|nr:C47 family peptidase [Staphylococcus sp. HMSC065E08]OFO98777.1 hypothetical protein HMPREF3007_01915 [Staphylococcus sp. HMSC065E08]